MTLELSGDQWSSSSDTVLTDYLSGYQALEDIVVRQVTSPLGPRQKSNKIYVLALSSDGKSQLAKELVVRLWRNEWVQRSPEKILVLHSTTGESLVWGRRTSPPLVTSPQGKITAKEYIPTSANRARVVNLARSLSPDEGTRILEVHEAIVSTATKEIGGKITGVDRDLTFLLETIDEDSQLAVLTASKEVVKNGLITKQMVAAAPEDQVYSVQAERGIVDNRPPKIIKDEASHTGNVLTREQQETDTFTLAFQWFRRRELERPDFLRRFEDFKIHYEESLKWLHASFWPYWIERNLGEMFSYKAHYLYNDVLPPGEKLNWSPGNSEEIAQKIFQMSITQYISAKLKEPAHRYLVPVARGYGIPIL